MDFGRSTTVCWQIQFIVKRLNKLCLKSQINILIIESFLKFLLWIISYSLFKKIEKNKIEIALLKDIENFESKSIINSELYQEKKVWTWKKIRKEHLQGPIIRSRAKRIEEGEKPRTYFCSLEYISQFLKQKYLMS